MYFKIVLVVLLNPNTEAFFMFYLSHLSSMVYHLYALTFSSHIFDIKQHQSTIIDILFNITYKLPPLRMN